MQSVYWASIHRIACSQLWLTVIVAIRIAFLRLCAFCDRVHLQDNGPFAWPFHPASVEGSHTWLVGFDLFGGRFQLIRDYTLASRWPIDVCVCAPLSVLTKVIAFKFVSSIIALCHCHLRSRPLLWSGWWWRRRWWKLGLFNQRSRIYGFVSCSWSVHCILWIATRKG